MKEREREREREREKKKTITASVTLDIIQITESIINRMNVTLHF